MASLGFGKFLKSFKSSTSSKLGKQKKIYPLSEEAKHITPFTLSQPVGHFPPPPPHGLQPNRHPSYEGALQLDLGKPASSYSSPASSASSLSTYSAKSTYSSSFPSSKPPSTTTTPGTTPAASDFDLPKQVSNSSHHDLPYRAYVSPQVKHSISDTDKSRGTSYKSVEPPPVSSKEDIINSKSYQDSMRKFREKAAQKMIVDLEGHKLSNYVPEAIKQISQKTGLSSSEVSALFNRLYPGSV